MAPNLIGALPFKLTVTDTKGASHSDTVTVPVQNREPIALAGPDKLITVNNSVTLEGSVSDWDPDDRDEVTPTWAQDDVNPADVTLVEVAGRPAHRTFTPEVAGVYTFTLTATDPYDLADTDDVTVRVLPSSQNLLPTRVSATPAARSVDISWNGPSIATGYEVEIGIPPSAGGQNHTFHTSTVAPITIGSLIPQKTYEYRVRMTNSDGVGPWTAWTRMETLGETPPTPTSAQWDVQYLNNKIQVKVTELPEVIPTISEVWAKLGIGSLGTGLRSNQTTATKAIGTTLNQWVDVLTSTHAEWQVGTWTAQIRFENRIGNSAYSTGKPVTVPNQPPTAVAGRDQIALVNSEVTLMGSVSDLDPADRASVTHTWTQDSGPATVILTTPTDEPGPSHLHAYGGWHVRLSPSPPPTSIACR